MESYTVEESGCWQWTGKDDGTTPLTKDGKNGRLATWRKENGAVPDGMWVVNKCGNCLCVAPDHQTLRLPTQKEAAEWRATKAERVATDTARRRAELDAQTPKTVDDFEAYCTKAAPYPDGPTCWNWNLGYSKDGYPTLPGISDDGKWTEVNVAHKVMEAAGRPRPPASSSDPLVARRECKNKKCVNPLHLKWVTRASLQAESFSGNGRYGSYGFRNNRAKWR